MLESLYQYFGKTPGLTDRIEGVEPQSVDGITDKLLKTRADREWQRNDLQIAQTAEEIQGKDVCILLVLICDNPSIERGFFWQSIRAGCDSRPPDTRRACNGACFAPRDIIRHTIPVTLGADTGVANGLW